MTRITITLAIVLIITSCHRTDTLFRQLSSSHTNITFNNTISESDSINPLDMEFLYNGGGVAVGDFNNDSLPDLYFTASQVSNKLYLNKGKFVFEDVTEKAGTTGEGNWSNAASVVDINSDGWQDIYVCQTINKDPLKRANLLYINQGTNEKGIPRFKEMAAAYNLADTGFSVHAAFFDYDRDGDLDMYLVNTTLAQRNSTRFDGGGDDNSIALSDKLYRNNGSDALGHPWFTDVSLQAGIRDEGYGLGIAIADINNDGWKDVYVTNDFYGSDLLYINNQDGTFSERARDCFKHTSQNAMGNDVADINNDGLPDIISVDMNPEDNYRKKKNMNGTNYFIHEQLTQNGQVQQYVRNTLQLNNGLVPSDTGTQLLPSFSDISFYAGVAETDWSWNPSLADFDNDGFKDLIITNGYPRDVTDHDFATYRSKAFKTATKKELLDQIPQIKISNYAFHNTGQLTFENTTTAWGLTNESFSDGAVYADLDNDGDLDYVINNINEEAFVYENNSNKLSKNNYLNIRFNGVGANLNGLGAVANIYYNHGLMQTFENSPYRGYLSTVDNVLHFGLGANKQIDSVVITWPNGKYESLLNVPVNQTLIVYQKNALAEPAAKPKAYNTLFANITAASGINYRHQEFDYIDFNTQKLLPHKFSQFGPSIAAGDVDGDGLDDLFIGASASNTATLLLQQPNNTFTQKQLTTYTGTDVRRPEMVGVLLFDADGDSDLDIYACSGSNEFAPGTKNYQDQFYVNTGKGNLVHDTLAIPKNLSSKSCIKAADYDNDGDPDLFIGGRLHPGRYPEPVSSYIYRNDTKDGKITFTDVTLEVAPALNKIGLVCDVVWTDFDNDGYQDLIVAGEWMPLTFLKNNQGKFTNITATTGLQNKTGWWTSIVSGDFDNDGDMDYIAGNVGLNSFFKASSTEPVSIYAADFDGDNAYDAIPALYLPDQKGKRKVFPAHVRDDMVKQMISTRRKFQNYKSYAEADMQTLLTPEEMQKALVLKADHLASSYIQNNGNNQFTIKPLPIQAQLAPLNGMVACDLNGDSFLDLVINGNDYGNEVVNGQYDAMNGLVMLGDGKGQFKPMSLQQSGYYVPGDAKGLAALTVGNSMAFAATQNRKKLQLFSLKQQGKVVRFKADDVSAIIHFTNESKRKLEINYGTSFLSQSSGFIQVNNNMGRIEILNRKGIKRMLGKTDW